MDALSDDLDVPCTFKSVSTTTKPTGPAKMLRLLQALSDRSDAQHDEQDEPELIPLALLSQSDLARWIIDSLFVEPWSSGEVVQAILERPDHLRSRMCSDRFAQLIAQMFQPETALFAITVVTACAIALPGDPYEIAVILIPAIVPLVTDANEKIRDGAIRLGGEVIWDYPSVDEPFKVVMMQVTAFHMNAIEDGDFFDKSWAWAFFHALIHEDTEMFFTVVPLEWRGNLEAILLELRGFTTLDEFLESKLGAPPFDTTREHSA
jgi:hypothetical protein